MTHQEVTTESPTDPERAAAARLAALKGQSIVYFVQIGKHIKIGTSRNISGRLQSFRTSVVDPKLLLVVSGTRELERQLHGLLLEARATRELFHPDWRVLEFINYVKRGGGLAGGLQYLWETSPARRLEAKREAHVARVHAERLKKRELDAYYASLVADRKRRLGW